ncbi:MAG: thymidine kinase [Saccharofermentanales bacterium]|mgnify:FL=1|jgi:thymidine kinase|nr:thymidine kinase [Bacillota bacterium]NLB08495.1 thymidine kinase [Clostridiales bacterium]
MAKLYFRYGAMNSGKTTALMQVAFNYEERGMDIVLLKPSSDTKGRDVVVSRLGIERKVDALVTAEDNVRDIVNDFNRRRAISCVLVDEAQFLSAEQVKQLLDVAVLDDIPVICYGLRVDFRREGFPGSIRLLLLAHSIEELKTICRCGRKAIFNGRMVNGKFVFSGEQIAIDGEDEVSYESLCGQCYERELNKAQT